MPPPFNMHCAVSVHCMPQPFLYLAYAGATAKPFCKKALEVLVCRADVTRFYLLCLAYVGATARALKKMLVFRADLHTFLPSVLGMGWRDSRMRVGRSRLATATCMG
jgi:hypothetical protein